MAQHRRAQLPQQHLGPRPEALRLVRPRWRRPTVCEADVLDARADGCVPGAVRQPVGGASPFAAARLSTRHGNGAGTRRCTAGTVPCDSTRSLPHRPPAPRRLSAARVRFLFPLVRSLPAACPPNGFFHMSTARCRPTLSPRAGEPALAGRIPGRAGKYCGQPRLQHLPGRPVGAQVRSAPLFFPAGASGASRRRCWPRGGSGFRKSSSPKQNKKHAEEDLGEDLRRKITVRYVSTIYDVLAIALTPRRAAGPPRLVNRPAQRGARPIASRV